MLNIYFYMFMHNLLDRKNYIKFELKREKLKNFLLAFITC
jgi:hypothetical protein